jgi:hypothetical protein
MIVYGTSGRYAPNRVAPQKLALSFCPSNTETEAFLIQKYKTVSFPKVRRDEKRGE